MPTILDTLRKGTEYLEKHQIEEARLNMEHLVAHVLKIERMQLYLDFDRPLPEDSLEALRELTKRRSRGEPLQHLLGSVDFCGLTFATDRRALVPRPETEELTSEILKRAKTTPVRILDMGCGSGVIGLSLAHHYSSASPAPEVVLADLSDDALSLARENAAALQLIDAVSFVQSDLFSEVNGHFDLVAANLPYIADSENTSLSREVQRDPAMALYGGTEGTEVMIRFLSEAHDQLSPGGLIAMEFGIDQGAFLSRTAEDLGYSEVITKPDLSGIERFLFATKSP